MNHPPSESPVKADDLQRSDPGEERTPSTITVIDTQSFHPPVTPPPIPRPSGDDGSGASADSSSTARYEIRKVLGSGGFGTVSLAWDSTLQREVAIKRPASNLDAELKQTFLAEARLAAKVKHPGIVVVHDVGVDQTGDPFVVYEYLPGANLKERISKGPFPLRAALEMALALAEALAAAHQQGLTHRDLKPANILIDDQGKPHIADFGLATEHEGQADLRGQIAGTNRYMSPEQVRGESHYLDGRTDLWSLGVILYEMLTGQTPFPGKQEQVFDQILHREPRPPRQWISSIPKPVEEIVLKLLSKPLNGRFASASDVVDQLKNCLQAIPGTQFHESDPAKPGRTAPLPRADIRRSTIALVILVATMASGWGIYAGWRTNSASLGKAVEGDVKGHSNQRALPPTDDDFKVDAWHRLLDQEPWPILLAPGAQVVHSPSNREVWVKTEYAALLQCGETHADSFSIRMIIEPLEWDGEAGLFLGWSPAESVPNSDSVTLLGVARRNDGGITLAPRTMLFQRQGNQQPFGVVDPLRGKPELALPKDGKALIHVDVQDGRITALFLNSQPIQFEQMDKIASYPAKGKFGIYSLGKTCTFSASEIRIMSRRKSRE